MRRHHQATAEIGKHFTRIAVEFKNRINRVRVAVNRHACAEIARATALVGNHLPIGGIDIDSSSRPPIATRWQVAPILGDHWVRVWHTDTRNAVAAHCFGLRRR